MLALVDVRVGDRTDRYAMAFAASGGGLRPAVEGDGTWRALAAAIADGRTLAAMPRDGEPGGTVGGAGLRAVARPGATSGTRPGRTVAAADERPLGRDQSNTSVVLGERLLLKAYRRIQPGLNPDLELTAYLSEEAAFPGVPRLAGSAEVVTRDAGVATVAMLQAFVPGGEDAYESTAERLAAARRAGRGRRTSRPTRTSPRTSGILVAGLHGALASPPADAPDLAPRAAGHDDLRALAHRRDPPAQRRGRRRRQRRPRARGRASGRRARDHRALLAVRGRRHGSARDAHPRATSTSARC